MLYVEKFQLFKVCLLQLSEIVKNALISDCYVCSISLKSEMSKQNVKSEGGKWTIYNELKDSILKCLPHCSDLYKSNFVKKK